MIPDIVFSHVGLDALMADHITHAGQGCQRDPRHCVFTCWSQLVIGVVVVMSSISSAQVVRTIHRIRILL